VRVTPADRRITLALDASTALGSVAVLRGRTVVAEVDVPLRSRDSERLMPAVAQALELAGIAVSELDAVACGAGPGSFTGLRIAGAIAKGLAAARQIPLFPVPTHLLLVLGARPALPPGRYLALLDAMRGEQFAREVVVDAAGSAQCAGPVRLVSLPLGPHELEGGARRVGAGEEIDAAPRARGVAALIESLVAADAAPLEAWEPFYGRHAEAQVRWEAAHGRPLA
jgi:tRNA threonylcarbamoyladenosine biosynthesis protein TsaB